VSTHPRHIDAAVTTTIYQASSLLRASYEKLGRPRTLASPALLAPFPPRARPGYRCIATVAAVTPAPRTLALWHSGTLPLIGALRCHPASTPLSTVYESELQISSHYFPPCLKVAVPHSVPVHRSAAVLTRKAISPSFLGLAVFPHKVAYKDADVWGSLAGLRGKDRPKSCCLGGRAPVTLRPYIGDSHSSQKEGGVAFRAVLRTRFKTCRRRPLVVFSISHEDFQDCGPLTTLTIL
jgi:hypothetical protein